MRLGKTTLFHFLSQGVSTLAGFAATFLIAVLLGPEGLGTYAIMIAVGVFTLSIPLSGLSTAVRKRMSEGEAPEEFFSAGVFAVGVATLVLVALVILASTVIRSVAPRTELELLSILARYGTAIGALTIGRGLLEIAKAGLEGQKRVAEIGGLQAVERLLRTTLQAGILLVGFSVAGLAFAHAFSLALIGLVGTVLVGYRPRLPARERVADIADYARLAWMGMLSNRIFNWMDTIVLSLFVGADLIGIYEAAWGLASMLGMVSLSINRTLFPEASELSAEGAFEHIKHIHEEGLVFSGIFVIPGFAGAAVIGQRLLRFYRPEFGIGKTVLAVLILAYAGNVYASQFLNIVNAVDRPDVAYWVNLAFIVTNLVLNLLLVWQFGWLGAAVATAVASALRTTLAVRGFVQVLGRPSIPVREIALEGIAAGCMAGVVVALEPLAPEGRLGTLLLVGGGATVYFLLLLSLSVRIRSKAGALARSVA